MSFILELDVCLSILCLSGGVLLLACAIAVIASSRREDRKQKFDENRYTSAR